MNYIIHLKNRMRVRYALFKKRIVKQMPQIVVFLCALFFPIMTFANPQGGSVVSGSAVITRPSTQLMQINQTSHKTIINWQSFNVSQ
ncbi:MAG TPA: hypothetical protein VHZ76_07675, partial [Gammaproteobacteria bacterium]|nr:hypothetical protein [Gammaproteobacteria bacterium]